VVRFNPEYPGAGNFRLDLMSRWGSFAKQKYGLTASGKGSGFAATGGVAHAAEEGFRDNSRFGRTNAFVSSRFFTPVHSLAVTLQLVDLYAQIPSSLNEEDFLNSPEQAGGSWGTAGGYEAYTKVLGGMTLESNPSERFQNHFTVFSTFNDPYERRPFNTLDESSLNTGFRERAEYSADHWRFSAGVEYFHEWYRWKIFETLPSTHGQLISDRRELRRYFNGFTLVQWEPGSRLLVDLAFNVNILSYKLDTDYPAGGQEAQGNYRYQPAVSPRIGVSFAHSGKIRSYAAAGHGFSAPSLEETLLPEGEVNTGIRPETGWNFEIGNRGMLSGGRIAYDLTGYTILLRDMLVTERVSEDVFTGINAGKALNLGVEAFDMHRPEFRDFIVKDDLALGCNICYDLIKLKHL